MELVASRLVLDGRASLTGKELFVSEYGSFLMDGGKLAMHGADFALHLREGGQATILDGTASLDVYKRQYEHSANSPGDFFFCSWRRVILAQCLGCRIALPHPAGCVKKGKESMAVPPRDFVYDRSSTCWPLSSRISVSGWPSRR